MAQVLGLTGGSGVGKGTVSALLVKHTQYTQKATTDSAMESVAPCAFFAHIDADAVYRDLLATDARLLAALCDAFGDVSLPDGGLNRPKLAQTVFADAAKLAQLGKITTPFIRTAVRQKVADYAAQGVSWVIYDAPTLFEAGGDADCDYTVGVIADRAVRLTRIMVRDGLSASAAAARVDAQPVDNFYRAHCDCIIENNGDMVQLAEQVAELAQKLIFHKGERYGS